MNKYINEIEQNNSFIKKFIKEFNKLLLEEKSKKSKGCIKIKTINDYYKETLLSNEELKKYEISKSSFDYFFELRRLNKFSNNEEIFFIHRVSFIISKKNNEVKIESINIRKILNKEISIDYKLEKENSIIFISLSCNETGAEQVISIIGEEVKNYDLMSLSRPSNEYEKHKKIFNAFLDIIKINKDSFMDYLFFGKDMNEELADFLNIMYDINLKYENIFRINFKNQEYNKN